MAHGVATGRPHNGPEMEELVRRLMDDAHVPGVAVGVLELERDRETLAGFGVTNIEHPVDVTPDTLFQVGSISKTVTATACMRLVERGLLDLDAPVRRYLPELRLADPDTTERLTARHLLTHTSGLFGDDWLDGGQGDDHLARTVEAMARLPQLTPLGAVRSYCNTGFALLGRVVEVLTGSVFEDAIHDLVFVPAGMDNTWYLPADVMTRRFAVGHEWRWDTETQTVARPWPVTRSMNPAGGVASSVRDLLRYARLHLSDDPVAVAMREPQLPRDPGMERGIAWALHDVGGERAVEHGGSTLGFRAALTLVPARGFAVAVLTNGSRGQGVHGPVVDHVLHEWLGVADPQPAPYPADRGALDELAGTYRGQTVDYAVVTGDGGLVVTSRPTRGFPRNDSPLPPAPPDMRMRLIARDRLQWIDPPNRGLVADVLRGEDGAVRWIRFGGRVCPRV